MSEPKPNELIPIARRPERLGIGLKSVNGVYRRAKADPAFPPIYKIKCRNYVRAGDLARYREALELRARLKSGGRRHA